MATTVRLRQRDIGGAIGQALGEGFSEGFQDFQDEERAARRGAEIQEMLDVISSAGSAEEAMAMISANPKFASAFQTPEDLATVAELARDMHAKPQGKDAEVHALKLPSGRIANRILSEEKFEQLASGIIDFDDAFGPEFANAEFATEADEAREKEAALRSLGEDVPVVDGITGRTLGTVNSRDIDEELIQAKFGDRAVLETDFSRGLDIRRVRQAEGAVEIFKKDDNGDFQVIRREPATTFRPENLGPGEVTKSVVDIRQKAAQTKAAAEGTGKTSEVKSDAQRIARGQRIRKQLQTGTRDHSDLTEQERDFLAQANASDAREIRRDMTTVFRVALDEQTGIAQLLDESAKGNVERFEKATDVIRPLLDRGLSTTQVKKTVRALKGAVTVRAFDIKAGRAGATVEFDPLDPAPRWNPDAARSVNSSDIGKVFMTNRGLAILTDTSDTAGGDNEWFFLDELGIQ